MSNAIKSYIGSGGWIGTVINLVIAVIIGFILIKAKEAMADNYVSKEMFVTRASEIDRRINSVETGQTSLGIAVVELNKSVSRLNGTIEQMNRSHESAR